jgi:hypothetical protein
MAVDRRVIMRTSVVPSEQVAIAAVPGSLEEYNISKATYNDNHTLSSIGRLGGSSLMTDITAAQWGDGWSSFSSTSISVWEDNDEQWEVAFTNWGGSRGGAPISTTETRLSTDGSDLQFCYIKNLGSTAVIISLDGDSTYPLKLSGGASTMFRGYSTNLKINEVYVKTASSTSSVEYLIAK